MKFKLDRNAQIKIVLIVAFIVAAPYFAPFAIDFIVLADFMGLEALLVLTFVYARSMFRFASAHLAETKRNIVETALLIAELPLFRPRIYFAHATVSTLLAVFACTLFLACLVWMPVMVISVRYMV